MHCQRRASPLGNAGGRAWGWQGWPAASRPRGPARGRGAHARRDTNRGQVAADASSAARGKERRTSACLPAGWGGVARSRARVGTLPRPPRSAPLAPHAPDERRRGERVGLAARERRGGVGHAQARPVEAHRVPAEGRRERWSAAPAAPAAPAKPAAPARRLRQLICLASESATRAAPAPPRAAPCVFFFCDSHSETDGSRLTWRRGLWRFLSAALLAPPRADADARECPSRSPRPPCVPSPARRSRATPQPRASGPSSTAASMT